MRFKIICESKLVVFFHVNWHNKTMFLLDIYINPQHFLRIIYQTAYLAVYSIETDCVSIEVKTFMSYVIIFTWYIFLCVNMGFISLHT
jgi:hypothetical protein